MVYASPDSPNTGYPDFRLLTANDIVLAIGVAPSSLNANTSNIANTDANGVYFSTPPFEIPANTLEAGSTFRITVISDNLAPLSSSLVIKFGVNGNLSDANVYKVTLPGYEPMIGSPQTGTYVSEFLVTVRSNTAQTMVAMTTPQFNGATGPTLSIYQPTQTSTINIAANNFLGVAFYSQNTSVQNEFIGLCEYNMVVIQQVK